VVSSVKSSPDFPVSKTVNPSTEPVATVPVEGLPVLIDLPIPEPLAVDHAYTFKVSGYVKTSKAQYLQVYGIRLYQYRDFDKENMIVTLSESQIPLALKMQLTEFQNPSDSSLISVDVEEHEESKNSIAYYQSLLSLVADGSISVSDLSDYSVSDSSNAESS
jgi:hypothetical protein